MGSLKRGVVIFAGLLVVALGRALVRHREEIFGSGKGLAVGLGIVAVIGFLLFVTSGALRRGSSHLEGLTEDLGWLPGGSRRWLALDDDTVIREWEGKRVGLSYWAADSRSLTPESVQISVEAPFPGAVSLVRRSHDEVPGRFGLGPRPTVDGLTRIFRAEGDLELLDRLVADPEIVSRIDQILSMPADELTLERGRLRLKASMDEAKILPAPPQPVFSAEQRQPIDALVFAVWDAVQRLYRIYSAD